MGDSYGAARDGWAIISHDTQDHCVRTQWAQCPCLPWGGNDDEWGCKDITRLVTLSPLHFALRAGRSDVVKLLLDFLLHLI